MAPQHLLPQYPVYVPSKGRAAQGHTMKFLLKDQCPFFLVVEPQEVGTYRTAFPTATLLPLPWNNRGLIAARNWIKTHATEAGYARHWQLDDNIHCIKRRLDARRIPCRAGVALRCTEDFVDRYENVAVAGFNYEMFAPRHYDAAPFLLNVHVYSASFILNSLPYGWRLRYNDDTDLCLRVLADGWCTVQMNAFLIQKIATMKVTGGNTTDLYQGDGRLVMARTLERMWPGVVETKRRFNRPQHVIKDAWGKFDTPLKLKPGIDLEALRQAGPNEYGMELRQVGEVIKAESLRDWAATRNAKLT